MKIDIIVPAAGESVTEGDIARWMRKSGDIVEMDEPLLELETEKASLEITAEADGRLTIVAEEGETVQVGAAVGYIEEVTATEKKKAPLKQPDSASTEESVAEVLPSEDKEEEENSDSLAAPKKFVNLPSPAARKLMAEHNISSQDITTGSGKDQRITKEDVLKFIEQREQQEALVISRQKFIDFYGSNAPVISPDETITLVRRPSTSDLPEDQLHSELSTKAGPGSEKLGAPEPGDGDASPTDAEVAAVAGQPVRTQRREKLTRLRKTISRRLIEAQQGAALLSTFNEVDMSAIMDIRKKYREDFKEAHKVGLGFMSFFTKAAAYALRHFPIINAQMDEDEIVYFDYCDIGIAVASPKGLVVPVIRNAESKSFEEIEKAIEILAGKGRDGELSLDELTGGTFTITNGGRFGSMLSTPIVNRPQSAILGMHNIVDRPVVRDGEVVVRPIMYVALTYDHRIIDGSDAVRFLVSVKEACEDPVKLLLDL